MVPALIGAAATVVAAIIGAVAAISQRIGELRTENSDQHASTFGVITAIHGEVGQVREDLGELRGWAHAHEQTHHKMEEGKT